MMRKYAYISWKADGQFAFLRAEQVVVIAPWIRQQMQILLSYLQRITGAAMFVIGFTFSSS